MEKIWCIVCKRKPLRDLNFWALFCFNPFPIKQHCGAFGNLAFTLVDMKGMQLTEEHFITHLDHLVGIAVHTPVIEVKVSNCTVII